MRNSTLHYNANPPPDDTSPAAGSLYGNNEVLNRLLTAEPVTDLAHAELFSTLYRNKLIYVPESGWMLFNGKYWEGGEHKILGLAGEVIKRRIAAFRHVDPGCLKAETRQALDCLASYSNAPRLSGMITLARGLLHTPVSVFDANPYHLNVGNGVIDLKTGELLPHSPEQYNTKWSPIHYHPDAKSTLWEETITGIACGDAELIAFFQRLAGYAASGDVSAQLFFYFYGEGANGKSLMTDLWAEVLGGFGETGYAVRIPNESIHGPNERTPGGAYS